MTSGLYIYRRILKHERTVQIFTINNNFLNANFNIKRYTQYLVYKQKIMVTALSKASEHLKNKHLGDEEYSTKLYSNFDLGRSKL